MRKSLWMVFSWGVAQGCSVPDVVGIDAVDGDVVASLNPDEVEETVFEDDLPVTVSFDVSFDETMSLPSARDNIWIEDAEGVELDVDLEARLQTITVVPSGPLEPAQNHTLVIQAAIQDNNETSMISGYRVAFFTAE